MKIDRDNISQFIIRNLQGKLTKEEARALEAWIQEKPERREWVDSLSDRLKIGEQVRLFESFDIPEGWKKVKAACWGPFLRKRFRYLKIAVVIFLCLGGSIFYLSQEAWKDEKKQELSFAEVRPGLKQAVLVLENGKEVKLRNDGKFADNLYGKGWKVEVGGKLCYEPADTFAALEEAWHILRIPRGGEYVLLLEDGTQVRMNSESELKYPVRFGQSQRKVVLTGEAYFQVAHDAARAFVVETDRMDVRVFGTSFNVMAYPDETTFYTTLLEGSVEVSGKDIPGDRIRLRPGWQAACGDDKLTVSEVDIDLCTAWIQGRFAFKSEELEKVLRRLERWYNVNFQVTDESIRQKRFTGSVSRYGNITKILEMLELTTNIHFEISGDRIVVSKN